MKVFELMQKLSELPAGANVLVNLCANNGSLCTDATSVIVDDEGDIQIEANTGDDFVLD